MLKTAILRSSAICAAVVLIAACASKPTPPPAVAAENATPNDTARFLAGLPPAPESPLAALTRDPGWQHHAAYFNSVFDHE